MACVTDIALKTKARSILDYRPFEATVGEYDLVIANNILGFLPELEQPRVLARIHKLATKAVLVVEGEGDRRRWIDMLRAHHKVGVELYFNGELIGR